MHAPAFPTRHAISLALQSLVEHMLHDVNVRLHPIASTTADQLCMGVAGDAPQALSIRPPPGAVSVCTGYGFLGYYLGSRAPAHSAGRIGSTAAGAHLELQNPQKSNKNQHKINQKIKHFLK